MVWLLSLCSLLSAQTEPGQWVGDLYMVTEITGRNHTRWVFLDEQDIVCKVIPNIEDAVDFPGLCETCGGISLWSHWHGDTLHTLAKGPTEYEGGREYRHHVFAKWQDGEWLPNGAYRTGRDMLHAVPCDGGRFILISSRSDLCDDKRLDRSPFCRMSVVEGREELRLDASIDHGQDGLRKHFSDPGCFEIAWFSQIILTDGRATLVNKETGLYWVFSTETATLVKAGSIFKEVTPEMIAKGGFEDAVLCANPEKSGTVLVSAQDETLLIAEKENAWKEYHDLWYSYPEEARPADEVNALYYKRLEEIRSRSPLIVWYRIHPENGRVEKLPVPPEGGASLREGWDNEWWRPMPDGSVKMGWHVGKLSELKERVSKPTTDPNVNNGAKEESVAEDGEAPEEPALITQTQTHPVPRPMALRVDSVFRQTHRIGGAGQGIPAGHRRQQAVGRVVAEVPVAAVGPEAQLPLAVGPDDFGGGYLFADVPLQPPTVPRALPSARGTSVAGACWTLAWVGLGAAPDSIRRKRLAAAVRCP
jgi:hypothetical protein